jgi:hypothetical protein
MRLRSDIAYAINLQKALMPLRTAQDAREAMASSLGAIASIIEQPGALYGLVQRLS